MWDPAAQYSSKIHYEARLHRSRAAELSSESRFTRPGPAERTPSSAPVLTALVLGVLTLAAVTGSALT